MNRKSPSQVRVLLLLIVSLIAGVLVSSVLIDRLESRPVQATPQVDPSFVADSP